MGDIRVLSHNQVESLFNMNDAISAVENSYRQKGNGQGNLWSMVFHEFEPGKADLDIKSGDLAKEQIFGLKVVSCFGNNPNKGYPALTSTSLLFDIDTGKPVALLDAGPITHYRTGAAAAIGAKYLARENSKRLLMCGSGHLAPNLVAAAMMLLPNLEKLVVVNPRNADKMVSQLPSFTEEVDRILKESGVVRTLEIRAGDNLQAEVEQADIIFTATPSYQPFIKADWVKQGTHLSCVGADMVGKQEIDSELFKKAAIFGDDFAQCTSVGECEIPFKQGVFSKLRAEIGEVAVGKKDGRSSDEEITIFDSTGIALQDLASASIIIRKAKDQNIGTLVAL